MQIIDKHYKQTKAIINEILWNIQCTSCWNNEKQYDELLKLHRTLYTSYFHATKHMEHESTYTYKSKIIRAHNEYLNKAISHKQQPTINENTQKLTFICIQKKFKYP